MSGNNEQHKHEDQHAAIYIKSSASSNGITTLLIGLAVALVGSVILIFMPPLFFLVGVLFLSGSIVAFVMGFYKLQEPKYSLKITKQSIEYYHRKGQWVLPWENIQRFDVPRVHKGLEHVDLELIGFRLRDPEPFLQNISPRLITHLLMEQRPLVAQVIANSCKTGQCPSDDIIEDTKYKCQDGRIINGVSAMFAHRMRKLQQGLGYDIFVSVNDVDRTGADFVALLRECQDALLAQKSV